MADTYRNFDDLRKHEGRFFQNSYKIVAKDRKSKITCISYSWWKYRTWNFGAC